MAQKLGNFLSNVPTGIRNAIESIMLRWFPTATLTLTNKTLTAPVLTAPVISGAATIATGAVITSPTIQTPTINGGTISADITLSPDAPADGAWDGSSFVLLGTGVDLITFTPAVGKLVVLWCTDSTADATVTCPAGATFDGSNAKATFADVGDALVLIGASATRWNILLNIGSVTFGAA